MVIAGKANPSTVRLNLTEKGRIILLDGILNIFQRIIGGTLHHNRRHAVELSM